MSRRDQTRARCNRRPSLHYPLDCPLDAFRHSAARPRDAEELGGSADQLVALDGVVVLEDAADAGHQLLDGDVFDLSGGSAVGWGTGLVVAGGVGTWRPDELVDDNAQVFFLYQLRE